MEPIKSVCGNFISGMKLQDISEKDQKLIFDFNEIDKNKDEQISEDEILKSRDKVAKEKRVTAEILKWSGASAVVLGSALSTVTIGPILVCGGIVLGLYGAINGMESNNIKEETHKYMEALKGKIEY